MTKTETRTEFRDPPVQCPSDLADINAKLLLNVAPERSSADAVRRSKAAATWAVSGAHNAATRAHCLEAASFRKPEDEADLAELLDALRASDVEDDNGTARLHVQAISLDAIFTQLLIKAMVTRDPKHADQWMRHALRAQAQCRTTLQTISDIQHPRQYIAQQNVTEQYNAAGHQQVNRDARAGARENAQTELSDGDIHELHPNPGAPAGSGRASKTASSVGALDGATD